jgi:hypothetical protein
VGARARTKANLEVEPEPGRTEVCKLQGRTPPPPQTANNTNNTSTCTALIVGTVHLVYMLRMIGPGMIARSCEAVHALRRYG